MRPRRLGHHDTTGGTTLMGAIDGCGRSATCSAPRPGRRAPEELKEAWKTISTSEEVAGHGRRWPWRSPAAWCGRAAMHPGRSARRAARPARPTSGRPDGSMRFVDEYRDPAAARALVAHITELAGDDRFKFMEVCGGHTHTIYRHGIEHVLPGGRRARPRSGLPGVRHPDGPGRRRHRRRRDAWRHLHVVRRHDAGAGQQREPARGEGPGRRRAVRVLAARRPAAGGREPRP